MAVVFDLDGTLCDPAHRRHLLDAKPIDWLAYSMACADDAPIEPMVALARILYESGETPIFLTGRNEQARELTHGWLRHRDLGYRRLIMRPEGDHRPNPTFKASHVQRLLDEGVAVDLLVDDHPEACDAVRALGVPTLHYAGTASAAWGDLVATVAP